MVVFTIFFMNFSTARAAAADIIKRPFGGPIVYLDICCNGIMFALAPIIQGSANFTFIMGWNNMIPIPEAGLGLYSMWSFMPGNTVLGSATPAGVCMTIYTECVTPLPVMFSSWQMGTNLVPFSNV